MVKKATYEELVQKVEDLEKAYKEKQLIEESFFKRQKYLEAIFYNAPDAIVTLDSSHHIIEWNPGAEKIFGYSSDEVRGKNLDDLVTRADVEQEAIDNTLSVLSGQILKPEESIRYRKDGTPVHVTLSGAPIIVDNELMGVVSMYTDISDRKKIENQLHQSQKIEAIGTLAGGIAHDFNNILSGIFGYTQLANSALDDPIKTKKNLDQIIKGAERAAQLVRQILAFSRQTELKKHPLKLNLEIKEAIKFLRSSIPAAIEIQENILSGAKILADPTQIHQVVMNLCTNAYQAIGNSGGTLTVGLTDVNIKSQNNILNSHKFDKYVMLEVKDTGYGMNKKTIERIFDPYYTTKTIGKGTGLGLSVVDGIVKDHNGYIKIYSRVGKGSAFQVFWPVIET